MVLGSHCLMLSTQLHAPWEAVYIRTVPVDGAGMRDVKERI
jgi:hypothetical protein